MTTDVTGAAERTADLSALIRTYLQNQGVRRASYHATELSVILRDAGHLADPDLTAAMTDAEVTAADERTADLALRCAELTMLRDTAMARWNRGRAAWRSARRRAATLTAERDRARDIAVALEGQVAAVRALADAYAREAA